MSLKKEKLRKIPLKNYFVAILLTLGAVLITLYGFGWYKLYENEKLANSYLMTSGTILHEIKNFEELNAVLSETPSEYFLYISYTNSKAVYDLEKGLKKIIEDYKLKEEFYFLNVTDIKEDKDFLDRINNSLDLPFEITKVPIILYFKDKTLVDDAVVIREYDQVIEAADFQHLIDKFEITRREG